MGGGDQGIMAGKEKGRGVCTGRKRNEPSSFPRTRFTAPEQPPHDMLTLNLYVCSADILAASFFLDDVCGGVLNFFGLFSRS